MAIAYSLSPVVTSPLCSISAASRQTSPLAEHVAVHDAPGAPAYQPGVAGESSSRRRGPSSPPLFHVALAGFPSVSEMCAISSAQNAALAIAG